MRRDRDFEENPYYGQGRHSGNFRNEHLNPDYSNQEFLNDMNPNRVSNYGGQYGGYNGPGFTDYGRQGVYGGYYGSDYANERWNESPEHEHGQGRNFFQRVGEGIKDTWNNLVGNDRDEDRYENRDWNRGRISNYGGNYNENFRNEGNWGHDYRGMGRELRNDWRGSHSPEYGNSSFNQGNMGRGEYGNSYGNTRGNYGGNYGSQINQNVPGNMGGNYGGSYGVGNIGNRSRFGRNVSNRYNDRNQGRNEWNDNWNEENDRW